MLEVLCSRDFRDLLSLWEYADIVFSIIMGKLAGFVAMLIMAITGLITIYVKQRGGLHNKKRYKGVFVYRELYVH